MTQATDVERHRYPYFLPDGRHFLFFREQKGLWAGSLDSPEIKQVSDVRTPPVYAPPGWLLFFQNGALVAQAFDAGKLTVSGDPILMITGAQTNARRFSVSETGVLVWQGQWQRDYQLVGE